MLLLLFLLLLSQIYEHGVTTVKAKLLKDAPPIVKLQMDGWTAAHTGYMGAILGEYCVLMDC